MRMGTPRTTFAEASDAKSERNGRFSAKSVGPGPGHADIEWLCVSRVKLFQMSAPRFGQIDKVNKQNDTIIAIIAILKQLAEQY